MPLINASTLITGNLEGAAHGATISLILDHSEPGDGPRLHRHPYDETWLVLAGQLTFTAGDQEFEAGPDDIVIVPPDTPHKFINRGTERARLICIHASSSFQTEWLE